MPREGTGGDSTQTLVGIDYRLAVNRMLTVLRVVRRRGLQRQLLEVRFLAAECHPEHSQAESDGGQHRKGAPQGGERNGIAEHGRVSFDLLESSHCSRRTRLRVRAG